MSNKTFITFITAVAFTLVNGVPPEAMAAIVLPPPPPVCDADGPYGAECEGVVTSVELDGSGSVDNEGFGLAFLWNSDCPGGIFDDPTSATPILDVDSSPACALDCNVMLMVTDGAGNSDTCSATVSIDDTVVPSITCPANITIECDDSTEGSAPATDSCDPDVEIAFSDSIPPGACPEESEITRTWAATDACGNVSTCVQTISLVDTTPPVVACNAPATITPPDAPISFIATSTDNCDGDPSVEITGFDCFSFTKKGKRIDKTESCVIEVDGGTITILDAGGVGNQITWSTRATDSCGNQTVSECGVEVLKPGMP